MHIILLHIVLCTCGSTLFVIFGVISYIPYSCNYIVITKPWMASIDRLRPLCQPAMHLLYYCCVSSLFYWRINVELSLVSWAAFLPIFTLLRPSVLDLGSGTGQTDVQTDRQTDRQTTVINA